MDGLLGLAYCHPEALLFPRASASLEPILTDLHTFAPIHHGLGLAHSRKPVFILVYVYLRASSMERAQDQKQGTSSANSFSFNYLNTMVQGYS